MENWKQELKEKGYTVLKGIIPPEMIAAARVEADRRHREKIQVKWDDEIPPIHNLLRKSPLTQYVEDAIGWQNVSWYEKPGQVAIIPARKSNVPWQDRPHIDGFFDPNTDPVPFAMLAGVYLSSTPGTFAGNFVVWPGSHVKHEKYFRERGRDALRAGQPFLYYDHSVQLVVEAGDAVLCHYLLAHAAAENTSDVDRVAVYFRIAKNGDPFEQLSNLWHGWKF
jgi:ectoine hydroxylase-related dioxygenase (phytanoyl-CoA dioxygenase family)